MTQCFCVKNIAISVLLLFGISVNAFPDEISGVWTYGPSLHHARFGHDVAAYNNKLYAIGGWEAGTSLEVFDFDSWQSLADLPKTQEGLAAALADGTIHTFGSYGNMPTHQVYDIATDTWSTGPYMPEGDYWGTAESAADSIFYISDKVYSFNITNNQWSSLGTFGDFIPASAVHENTLYIFGLESYATYDLATGTWGTFTPPPSGHGRAAEAVSVGSKIYLIGGNSGYVFEAYTDMEIYDPATDSWTIGPSLQTGRYQFGAEYFDGRLYVVGGRNEAGEAENTVEYLEVGITPSSVSETESPHGFTLARNYPNPFNPVTTIAYELPEDSPVTLTIYNTSGQITDVLRDEYQTAGRHSATWDGSDMPSGLYFFSLTWNGFTQTGKMVLMK